MVKLRDRNGKRWTVQDIAYIEVCDGDGRLAALVSIHDSGRVTVSAPGDDVFARYAEAFGSRVSEVTRKYDTRDIWKRKGGPSQGGTSS